ncbi:MAG: phosphomannomutase/phosphoglucomutase [Candidatus Sungbacteria bacterium]|nr:phosphomannomutase/phosphoglucomutase [Candidatus Sungbacteria bacterium]
MMNSDIFHAYDIRGKYPTEINEVVAERIGNAVARYLSIKLKKRQLTLIVVRDVRMSSPLLQEALIRGITAQGSDVIDAGIGTTPFFYFLIQKFRVDGGLMVTASHNPPEYNGFKIREKGGGPIFMGTGLERIKTMVLSQRAVRNRTGERIFPKMDYKKKYFDFLSKGIAIENIRAVIDAAGGSVTYFLPELLARFPSLTYKPLFFESDGSFSRHSPNPLLPSAQKFVQKELETGQFQFGAVFDGDGDRISFFDEKGNAIRSEFISALFMDEELKRRRGGTYAFAVNTSRGAREYIETKGGRIVFMPIGPPRAKIVMQRTHALYGTEFAPHFYFKKFFYNDSALMALLRLAQIISRTHRPLSQLVAPFARYISSDEINLSIKDKKAAMRRVLEFYRGIPGVKITKIDGISVDFSDWWFNLRPSNTEPYIRLVMEARTQELYDEKMKELERIIGKH